MRHFGKKNIILGNIIKNFTKRLYFALGMYLYSVVVAHAAEEADSKNYFVAGIYVGSSIMEMSSEYYIGVNELPGDYDKSVFGASYGAKVGYDMYFLKQHGVRLYLDYMHSYLNSNDLTLGKFSMHTIGLNTDYRFVITSDLSVFAGVGLTYNIINTQYLGDMGAFGGSINLGAAYDISFVEIELRLRYLAYDLPDKPSAYLPTILGQKTSYHTVDLNSPVSLHLGVNFRF